MDCTRYIQVIVPLRLAWIPTYSTDIDVHIGCRVRVRVSGRVYVGVVYAIGADPGLDRSRIRPIDGIEEGLPDISHHEISLWKFISEYYLCTIGEVYKAAYPSMKLSSERTAARSSAAKAEKERLTRDRMIASIDKRIARLDIRLARNSEAMDRKHNETVTARLQEERARIIEELESARQSLRIIQQQEKDVLMPQISGKAVPKTLDPGKPLACCGPGRTDRFILEAHSTVDNGRDVLIMVPDIIFSDRLEAVMRRHFPEMMVFNSRHSAVQRRKTADTLRTPSDKGRVVLGTRSAIFLPFAQLGLIIIDEEQDSSYKQDEPAPRYNGRDCAIKLAQLHGAKVMLGSDSPSMETLLNCSTGRYQFCGDISGTNGHCVIDIPTERRKNGMIGSFSRILLREIEHYDGPVTLIRGWEKPDELKAEAEALLPGRKVSIKTLSEARRSGIDRFTAVMQADALVSKDDFRADERALQLVAQLQTFADRLFIQTGVPQRWDGTRTPESLLEERRVFGFPPFTRLVKLTRGGVVTQQFLPRDRSLQARKAEILAGAARDTVIDVDPA